MTYKPRRHKIQSNATLTTSGNSGFLLNLTRSENPTIILVVDVQGTVSGTSPSLTVTVTSGPDTTQAADSANRFAQAGTTTAITTTLTTPQRVVISNVLEGYVQVNWTITGTTPSFGGVYIDLYMSSPDA